MINKGCATFVHYEIMLRLHTIPQVGVLETSWLGGFWALRIWVNTGLLSP